MKIPNIPFIIIAVVISIASVSCEPSANSVATNPWDDLPELHIDLPAEPASNTSAGKNTLPEPDENGMMTISIGVPPTFLQSGGYGENPAPEITTARKILERAGVSFPEGADANYDPITGLLNVHNTLDQIELVEAYTQPLGSGPEQQITCRFEVFELPSSFARELSEKADKMPNHQSIRDQVIAACRQGHAEFVTSVDLPCRSGQRAKTETGARTLVAVAKRSPETIEGEAEEEKELTPLLDWQQSGLEVEIDPVIGADGITIDLNLAFRQAIHPGTDSTGLPSAELTTNFTVIDQTTQLIGVFPAQETTTSGSDNRQRLVFIQATVRFLE